jgi:HPt (histidine-containing phosphotransfer) domain-containing protein
MTEKLIVRVDSELEDLMPLFMDTRKRDMEGLAKGLASNDFAALRVIGHGMKGSGGAFGFQLVTDIGGIIEASALQSDAATIEKQFTQLRDYLARVEVQYVSGPLSSL